MSTAGPLIASAEAVVPALAVAFWRTGLASAVLVPVTLARRMAEVRALTRREWWLAFVAGVFLACHFATWVPSLSFTPVASSTALVATQPIWQAAIARVRGSRIPGRAWVGIWIAVIGAGWLSGADLSLSARHLFGDLLAFIAAGFAALYVAVGAEVRRSVTTTTYTTICYGTSALLLLVVCVVSGASLSGYPASAWWKLAALAGGAQLLGHSLFNVVLRTTSATVVALTLLLEVPGAALIAAVWLGQVPPAGVWIGAGLIVAGIAVVVGARSGEPAVDPAA